MTKKTEALWIGANYGNEEISLPGRNFKWPKHKVKALGVWLSVDPEATATLNYNEKLDKIRNILSSWKYHRLTLIGKIAGSKKPGRLSTCLRAVSLTHKRESHQRSKKTILLFPLE